MMLLPRNAILIAAMLAGTFLAAISAGAQHPAMAPAGVPLDSIGAAEGLVRARSIHGDAVTSLHRPVTARQRVLQDPDRCTPSRPVAIAVGAAGGVVGGYLIYRLLSFGGDGGGSQGVRNGFMIVLGTLGAIEGARGRLRLPGCPRT